MVSYDHSLIHFHILFSHNYYQAGAKNLKSPVPIHFNLHEKKAIQIWSLKSDGY